jgi:hypothetical protein
MKKNKLIMILMLSLILSACGKVKADSTRADVIPSPAPGYKCFIIYDSNGTAVGGNCVKE